MQKKRHLFLARATMTLLLALFTSVGAWADSVSYINENGQQQSHDCSTIPNNASSLSAGWYVTSGKQFDDRLIINGDVKIILTDGVTITFNGGIGVPSGSTLTIYGQSNNSGKLSIPKQSRLSNSDAGIGHTGDSGTCGTINIHGGILEVQGGYYEDWWNNTAWIGRVGIGGSGGVITITGGYVKATGGAKAPGIGDCNSVTITGGEIIATGGGGTRAKSSDPWSTACGAGIGSYTSGHIGTITITGGKVTANAGGDKGYGIGAGASGSNGTIKISGGEINAGGIGGSSTTTELSWTKTTDYINCYGTYKGTVTLKKQFNTDGTLFNTGEVSDLTTIDGKRLVPYVLDGSGTESDPYVIPSTDKWNTFCQMLSSSTKGIFTGKYVKLTNDITVTTMAGSSQHDFTGIFDGGEHTLTFNYGKSGTATSEQYVAPFRYITNTDNTDATIKNLHVKGDIYTSAKNAAGIVAQHWGTLNIENCRSSIVIHSSITGDDLDGTHGGFEAVNNGVLKIKGCVFDGKLLTTESNTNCGGFVGWCVKGSTTEITNSFYAPANLGSGEAEILSSSCTFARNWSGTPTNSYYTRSLGTGQGQQAYSVNAGTDVIIEPTGSSTVYNVSDITAYSKGLKYNNLYYAGSNEQVSLTLSTSDTSGRIVTYVTSAGSLTGSANPYTLKMPTDNVTISIDFHASSLLGYSSTYDPDGSEQKPYIINSVEGWNYFCDAIEDNSAWNHFTGKTVRLEAPIIVSKMAGSSNHPFAGIFDGYNQTLTFNNTTASEDLCAPFRYVNGATIKRLTVAGEVINSGRQTGGLIAYAQGNNTINQCLVTASLTSSYSGDASNGGFIAHIQNGWTSITNCIFKGSLLGASATHSAGFVGYISSSQVNFTNCIFAPAAEVTMNTTGSATFNRNSKNSFTNCYYTTAFGYNHSLEKVVVSSPESFSKKVSGADGVTYYVDATAAITGVNSTYDYTGSVISITPTVTLGSATVSSDDYTLTITPSTVKEPGDYTLTITGKNDYVGTKSMTFKVLPVLNTDNSGAYVITSAKDWDVFCDYVNNRDETFSGKTVKLPESIEVSTMVGTSYRKFSGTFDGCGKTLTFNKTASDEYCAPFRYINGATIKNLTVTGTITASSFHAAGIAARNYGNSKIEDCVSNITLQINSGRYHGGFVGRNESNSTLSFERCTFSGSITGNYNYPYSAGFVGENNNTSNNNVAISYTDCLFNPATINVSNYDCATFNRDGHNGFTRTYYTNSWGAVQGVAAYITAPDAGVFKQITVNGTDIYIEAEMTTDLSDTYSYQGTAIVLTPTVTIDGQTVASDKYTVVVKDANNNDVTAGIEATGSYTLTVTCDGTQFAGSKTFPFTVINYLAGEGTTESPYLINNAANWEAFAANIGMGKNLDAHYKLTGSFETDIMIGDNSHKFNGHLDGNNQTLTFNKTASEAYCAPFRYVDGATIEKLTAAGEVSSSGRQIGGLIANAQGNNNIDHCVVTASLTCSYSGDASNGGFIANIENGTTNISNCVFRGSLLGTSATRSAGFVGYIANTEVNFTNCLFAPAAEVTMSNSGSCTFNRNGKNTFTNCYYTAAFGEAQGIPAAIVAPATDVYKSATVTFNETSYYAICDISGVNDVYLHTGSAIAVDPVVKLGNTTLTKNTHYTVTIKDSSKKIVDPDDLIDNGDYTLTITGMGDYAGSHTIGFHIMTGETLNGYAYEIGTDAEGTYYKIQSADDFEHLASYVASGNNVTSGKRFLQTADITVSSTIGSSESKSFQGIYDGQNKKLRLDIEATSNIMAPFCYVKGATIKDLTIEGSINNSGKQNGGVIGYSYGDVTISNCLVSASITSGFSGDSSNGGFIAHVQNGSVSFNNCTFTGSLLGESATCFGGFVGWRNSGCAISFTNCLFAPAEVTMSANGSATFNRNGTADNTYTNCYYLKSYGDVQGVHVVANAPATGLYKTVVAADNKTYFILYDITGATALFPYTGSAITFAPDVTFGDETLILGTHYTMTFENSGNEIVSAGNLIGIGNYTATIAGIGTISGSKTLNFRIANGETLDGYFFETGTDKTGKYYVIASEGELETLAAYVNSGHTAYGIRFKQTADIMMTAEHTAIGRNGSSFNGTFDGNDHSITNLYINKTGTDENNDGYQGLFGYVYSATIQNVNLVDCNITGYKYTAGIVGYIGYGSNAVVSNCTVSGSVQKAAGKSPDDIGGIAGYIGAGTIIGCKNHATISGYRYVGGIVGHHTSGTLNNNINDGEVTGNNSYIGSIAGISTSALSNNYYPAGLGLTGGVGASGVTTGTDKTDAEVMFTITEGNATTHLTTERIKEYNSTNYYKNGMELTLSYDMPDGKYFDQYTVSAGTLSKAYNIDGKHTLTGVTENITIIGTHSDKMSLASEAVTVKMGIVPFTGSVIDVAPEVKRLGVTLAQGTDYTFTIEPATVQAVGEYTLTITGQGNYTGTKQTTFYVKEANLIHNAEDWATFAANVNAGTGNDNYYKLADDFDNTTAVTATVGTEAHPFTGIFDGNGKTLNVNINETSTQGTAPFRNIAGATICNLTVSGSVTGTTHASGLVGFTRSGINNIENCVVNTNVTVSTGSNRHIGGVVGHGIKATLNISNTVYTGTLSNNNYAGGLLGWSDGSTLNITNCLVTGSKNGGNFHPIAIKNTGSEMNVTINGAFYTNDPTLTDVDHIAATGIKVYEGALAEFCKKEYVFNETNYCTEGTAVIGNIDNVIGYTGSAISLSPTVTYEGTALTANTDFTFATDPATVKETGEYTLTITGQGNYAGTQSMKFHVVTGILEGKGTETSPFVIASTDDWNKFVGNINNCSYNYSGQYVKMTEDVTVRTMAGNSEANSFQGTFLGTVGKTMTLDLTATANDCAPFRYLKNATVKDLNIAGSISTGYQYAGSVASHNYGTTYLMNCISTVEITSTFETSRNGTHAGFVALNESQGTLNISNCAFAGKLLGSNAYANGGFVGFNNGYINYTDCLFAPAEVTMSSNDSRTYNRNGGNSTTRAYYLTKFGYSDGAIAYTSENVPASGFFGQITAADGNTYYAQGFANNISNSYSYTGTTIDINPTISIADQSISFVKGTDFEVAFTKNGNPVSEMKEVGDYVVTISAKDGGKCKGSITKNVYVYVPVPTGLTVTEITASTATVTWTDDVATNWIVEISESSNFSTIVESKGVTEKSATFTGITPDVDYYVRVKAVDGETSSNWSSACVLQPSTKLLVGSGTEAATYLPSHNWLHYTLSQQIYTPDELGNKAGSILSIDFYRTDNNTCISTIDVYLVNTTKSSFASYDDWIAVTDEDKVFSGRVNYRSNLWTTITLDKPFDYDGTSNLALVVYHRKNNEDSYGSSRNFRVFKAASSQAIYYQSDNTDPTINPTVTGSIGDMKNQLRVRLAEKIHMNGQGIMTYASNNALDFENSAASDDLKAYAVTDVNNGKLTLSTVNQAPATGGLLMKGTASTTFYVNIVANADAIDNNHLVGVLDGETVVEKTDGDKTNFVLANGKHGINWYGLSKAGKIGANKAYLQLSTSEISSAREFTWVYDDGTETTGISTIFDERSEMSDDWYTIDGVKLSSKPTKKGLYIVNGRKTVVK